MKLITTIFLIILSLSLNAQQKPVVEEKDIEMATSEMSEHKEVQEAVILQQEDNTKKISLGLIVKKETSRKRAMELGDYFLRTAMTHISSENKPREKIGKTSYNYILSICTEKNVILLGTKTDSIETIVW